MNMVCCNGGYHEFNLDWFIARFKEIEGEWDGTKEWLKNWVESFDISAEVKKVLQGWIEDGTFERLINEVVLNDINEKVDSLEQELNTEKENIKENTADIDRNTADITELKTRKPINLMNKRFVMIADSYGEFGCMESFASALNGIIVEKIWVGGAGFTKTGDQQYLKILNDLPDHNDIDYVAVFGFYNDSFDVNNLTSAIITFKNQVQVKYPGAQLVLVNQGWSGNPEYQGNFQYLINQLNTVYASNLGCLISTWKVLHVYSNMQSDNIHPTENASKFQGRMAASILAGGNAEWIYPITKVPIKWINNWQYYGNWSDPFQEMNNSECLLHFVGDVNHVGIDTGTNITCNGHNYVEVFEFNANTGCIIGSGDMLVNIPCILSDIGGNYYQASCSLEIYNRRLRIRPYLLNAEGKNFRTINLNSIQWTPCTIRSNINHI